MGPYQMCGLVEGSFPTTLLNRNVRVGAQPKSWGSNVWGCGQLRLLGSAQVHSPLGMDLACAGTLGANFNCALP